MRAMENKASSVQGTGILVFTSLLTGLFAYGPSNSAGPSGLIRTDNLRIESGIISGIKSQGGDVAIFKGIPFGAPPIGDLRWRAPAPVAAWKGIRPCKAFGPNPMQGKPVPFSVYNQDFLIPAGDPISEDCLYLNVWTAAKSPKEKRPVIVWIYGGGFVSGSGSLPLYDGEAMAKKGIVFVTINYRLGIFGFFAHPDLSKESGHNASGNYGLMDQIAALHWVQKNIAAFGGDPSNVSIAGQSAGSMSVNCLVASPLAKGLFRRAIAESGAYLFSTPVRMTTYLKQAEDQGMKVMETVHASSLADLRNMSAADLMAKTFGFRGPIVDGFVLPASIPDIFASGKQNQATLLTGWNGDEGTALASLGGGLKSADDFKKQVQQQYGAAADSILKYYPASSDEQAANSQLDYFRDITFGVQNYAWCKMATKSGKEPVYLYNFTRKVPASDPYKKYGAFHTGEVAYAYDNLDFLHRPWEPIDHTLAQKMSDYWANFAKTGDPNGPGLVHWAPFGSQTNQAMVFDVESGMAPVANQAALDFLISNLATPAK
jgi:para-nitrobenzyl esterase